MASDSIADTGAPAYSELLDALCDLTFDPSNVAAQQHAQQLLARVPVDA